MYGNFLGVLFYEWFAEFNVQVSRQLNVQDECRGIEGITFTCACILIPLYNSYIIAKIVYGNGWKFLFSLIPIIRYIFPIMLLVRMAQAYGKSTGFGILNVFFPEIGLLLLGFGKCDYEGPIYSFM